MQRLVTQQDIYNNPELKLKGVSVNQHYDFTEPTNSTPPVAEKESENGKKDNGKKAGKKK